MSCGGFPVSSARQPASLPQASGGVGPENQVPLTCDVDLSSGPLEGAARAAKDTADGRAPTATVTTTLLVEPGEHRSTPAHFHARATFCRCM